jgi:L-rhamnose isomerase
MYVPGLVLHISRGVRWDSDHVVTLSDETQAIVREVVTGGYLDRVHIGLDYFDASINRIAAWAIGARNVMRAALVALLEPTEQLRKLENEGDYSSRLALLEEVKGLPWHAVWDYFCLQQNVPVGIGFMEEVKTYETKELSKRA